MRPILDPLPRRAFALTVTPEHLANRFKNASLPACCRHPVMITAMEQAALQAIKLYFDPHGVGL